MTRLDRVEEYSSHAYAVEPRAFYFEEMRHAVQAIERAWKTPGRSHYYLVDEHQRFFELIYEEATDGWFLRTFGESCRVEPSPHRRQVP